jgi:Flp pilus assembly protein TadB
MTDDAGERRRLLALFAACCIGPMVVIVVLSSVAGLAIGASAAISLGLVAGVFCVVWMVIRHRRPTAATSVDKQDW